MSKPRVLCFLDNPLGRDTEMVLPVTYLLETYLSAEVKFKFIWDMYFTWKWKPDVILLPSTRGHHMYTELADYGIRNNIIVLALESEGNFRTDSSYDFWGFNTSKTIQQEWVVCWSERIKKYLKTIIDEKFHHKIVVTGSSGFDRYRFEDSSKIEDRLKEEGLTQYTRVIGYAGWSFGKLSSADHKQAFPRLNKWKKREDALEWVEQQRLYVREVLRELITKNADTLFILKKHPKENFESDPIEGPNEMNELLDYENVLYIKTEEQISNIISTCDLWLGFETTTSLEAWLMGKYTLLINKEPDFPRTPLYQGSVITKDAEELQKYIDEFYRSGSIRSFHKSAPSKFRKEIIQESIGFNDGFNHIRVGYYFRQSIPKTFISKRVRLNLRHLRLYLLMHLGRFFYVRSLFLRLPKFRKTVYVFENRLLPGFKERRRKVYSELKKFHEDTGVAEDLANNNWHKFV